MTAVEPLQELDIDGFTEMRASGDPFFAFFWASWCTACKSMEPLVDELSREYPGVAFGSFNVDRNREVADRCGIRGVPSYVLFEDGEQVERGVAAKTRKDLEGMIEGAFGE